MACVPYSAQEKGNIFREKIAQVHLRSNARNEDLFMIVRNTPSRYMIHFLYTSLQASLFPLTRLNSPCSSKAARTLEWY